MILTGLISTITTPSRWKKRVTDRQAAARNPGLYGLPTGLDIRVLYSNSNALRQAGLVDEKGNPRPPQTWSELQADSKLLLRHNTDGTINRLGFAPNFGNSWLYLYTLQAGGRMLSADGTRVTMDSPEVVRALRYMTDVYDEAGGFKVVDGFRTGFQMGGAEDPFIKGQVALKVDGDWDLKTIAQNAPDLDFIITPAPMPDDRVAKGIKPVTWAGGFSLIIPSTAQEKDGAFKLLQFLSSRHCYRFLEDGNRQTDESKGRVYLPRLQSNRKLYEEQVNDNVFHNPKTPESFKKVFATLNDLLPNTLIRQPSPVGQLLWIQHIHAYEEAVNHKLKGDYKDENQEIRACLSDAQIDVQRHLDAITKPLPPHEVQWGGYFVGYSILILIPFIGIFFALKRNQKLRVYRRGETTNAMIFLSPWLIGMICLTAGPILFSIVLSFSRYDVLSNARYVGAENYRNLFSDPLFFKSLGNTGFMLLRIPLGMAVSLGIAMLLNRKIQGIGGYRTAFYMPVIVPVVACTLLWQALLNDNFGLVNVAIRWFFSLAPLHWVELLVHHLHFAGAEGFRFTAPNWLSDATWTKPSLILMGLWSAGGGMIIWLAGLQSIPAQLYEAATVDGASKWKQFLHVTVPMLSPYILFNAIMGVIGTMQIFTEAYIMFPTGGAEDSTLFYAFYLFRQSFQYFSMGYASALAWVLFIIVLALTLIQLYFSKRWVHYDQT